ncbi:MAG: hypothetical protein ACI8Z5_002479 [Lentimonas sp.]
MEIEAGSFKLPDFRNLLEKPKNRNRGRLI